MMFCILFLPGCYTDYQLEYAEEDGYDAGYDDGYAAGYDDGYNDGYRVNGGDDGLVIPDNYDVGYHTGYDFGYEDGYEDGCNDTEEYVFEYYVTVPEALNEMLYSGDLSQDILNILLEYYDSCWVIGQYFYQDGYVHISDCPTFNLKSTSLELDCGAPQNEDAKCPICFNESVKEKE